MVTWHFSLFSLSILTVFSQFASTSLKKIKSDRRSVSDSSNNSSMKLSLMSYTNVQAKDVPGFSLTDDEIRKFKIWPDGIIPYYIDVTSFSDKVLRDKIRSTLNMINSITPLNFAELPIPPPSYHTRFVFFINRKGLLGCADHSVWDFTTEGVQRVVLGYDCMNREGELAEAVLALAGVPAQHTAPNRDKYIKVFEDNIIPDKRKLFEKLSDSDWLFHDLPYDYNSMGHYHNFKYSMNGKTVIQPRNPDITIGETKELSKIDILKIKLLYNFIAQKKQLDVPECQKLFKPGSKFGAFVPNQIIVKPKKKPFKYTQTNINNDIDYIDDDIAFLDTKSDDNDKSSDDEKDLSEKKSNENDEDKEKVSGENYQGKPKIVTLALSDENSEHGKHQVLSLTKKINHKNVKDEKKDLLALLSDYQSGDEK